MAGGHAPSAEDARIIGAVNAALDLRRLGGGRSEAREILEMVQGAGW